VKVGRFFSLLLPISLAGTPVAAAGQDQIGASEAGARQIVVHSQSRPNYVREIGLPSLTPIPIPPPPVGKPPAVVRGIYMNAWTFGSDRFYNLLRLADTTEINTFVIDVKDGTGHVTYRSSVPTAIEVGANGRVRANDVRERLATLRRHGIHPVARIVVAKDPLVAKGKPQWAVRDDRGGLWRDRLDFEWVDAYRDSVWIYAADIAAEAVMMGFAEVQFDYVRFPDEPQEVLKHAIFSARRPGESRRDGVRRNVALLRDRLKPLGIPVTLDIFGLVTSATTDMGIGQVWEDLVVLADAVLPMVYPSHYYSGAYGFRQPKFEPYGVVRRALEDGLERSANIPDAAEIRPFLQSFSIRRARYTAREIRAQMQAGYDLGVMGWVLWNASGRYPPDAFLPAHHKPVEVADEPN
jgi:hypothetical protein